MFPDAACTGVPTASHNSQVRRSGIFSFCGTTGASGLALTADAIIAAVDGPHQTFRHILATPNCSSFIIASADQYLIRLKLNSA